MSYQQNKLMELVSMQKFMELDAFISIMESMLEVDLNHTSMRRQAQLRITQMFKQIPVVSGTARFPDKYHVNLSVGEIANLVRQLLKVMVSLAEEGKAIGFYDLLDEIRDYTFALDPEKLSEAGIYTRASFEEKYGFSWNA